MACRSCRAENQTEFDAEVNIHFPGRKSLDKPHVLTSAKLIICLDCGFMEGTLPRNQLRALQEGVTG
jgi:hypothetical protein